MTLTESQCNKNVLASPRLATGRKWFPSEKSLYPNAATPGGTISTYDRWWKEQRAHNAFPTTSFIRQLHATSVKVDANLLKQLDQFNNALCIVELMVIWETAVQWGILTQTPEILPHRSRSRTSWLVGWSASSWGRVQMLCRRIHNQASERVKGSRTDLLTDIFRYLDEIVRVKQQLTLDQEEWPQLGYKLTIKG